MIVNFLADSFSTRSYIENQNSFYPTANNQSITRLPLPISNQNDLSYSRGPIQDSSVNFNQLNIFRQDSFDTALYASCYADGRMSGSDLYAEILADNTSVSCDSTNPNPTLASQPATFPSSSDPKPADVNSYSICISRL